MVVLRSARQDRWLLVPVWALTVAALGLGIVLVAPILIFWGAVGLIGALFATRVLLRDVRSEAADTADAAGTADTAGTATTAGTAAPGRDRAPDDRPTDEEHPR
jgi:hypothetical protein